MLLLLAGLLGTPLHEYCDRDSYLLLSIVFCAPGILIPLFFPCKADRYRPFCNRFWVKAAVWIAIFSFYGNYFWTHYFYQLLGARYLFDAYRFNDVPVVCFICTFFYFTFYFSFVNVILRLVARNITVLPYYMGRIVWWATIAALAYGTAIFEAVSIQHFPLYTYTEKNSFLFIGSVVYGLYFVVGFPMFFSIDENPYSRSTNEPRRPLATLWEVAVNAFAATAIVTLLLDLWRLYLGNIYSIGKRHRIIPVPFIYQAKPRVRLFTRLGNWATSMKNEVLHSTRALSAQIGRTTSAWGQQLVRSTQGAYDTIHYFTDSILDEVRGRTGITVLYYD